MGARHGAGCRKPQLGPSGVAVVVGTGWGPLSLPRWPGGTGWDTQSDSRSVLSPCLSFPARPWDVGLRAWQLGRDGFYQIFGYLFARPGQLSPVGS